MEKERILIVDDEKTFVKRLVTILEMEGYEVQTAYAGRSALEMGTSYPFDAAILDIELPDMHGTELITGLLRSYPDMVIIMLTGFPDQENTMEALNLGAKGYMTKPIEPEKLIGTLREKLRQQKETIELTQERVGRYIQKRIEKMMKEDQGTF
jgi:DNA-binding response OmpR family regulator